MSDVMLLGRLGALATYIQESDRDDIFTSQDLSTIPIAQKELAKRADRIQELEAELEKHRWVPVSEELPEDGDRVLVFHPEWGIDFGWCHSPHWSTEFLVETTPTHWRYITPPKED